MRGGLAAALLATLASLAGVAPAARAGTVEPFLRRLAASAEPARAAAAIPESSPLFAWDREEAARGRVRVLLRREPAAEWEPLREATREASPTSRWEGEAGDWAQLVLPIADLLPVSDLPGVGFLHRPPRAQPTRIDSEGLEAMGVADFHADGFRGRNVRIAVVDLGFAGYEELLGTELPEDARVRSFFRSPGGSGDITGGGENHGTACAEIVHDIVPDAELYLVNIESPVDLKAAVDWLIEEQVSVISHSVGWYFGGLDGTGPINDVAANAVGAGILWVNAAGNEAQRHHWSLAEDAGGNGLLEFAPSDEELDFRQVGAGQTLAVVLLWDLWPLSTSLDLVLEVVDGSGSLLASSAEDFTGYPYAFRYLEWTSPDGRAVAVRVQRRRGSIEGRTIHLFRIGAGARIEEHARSDRSLLSPADSPDVLAVGAVDWETEQLEGYSSRGALDGPAPKPELCGPVGVTTRTYRDFRGTSAAAPHVAGAAALLASATPSGGYHELVLPRQQVATLLRESARAAPEIQPLAWGIVRMPRSPVETAAPRLLGNPAFGLARWRGACETAEIVDAAGRRVVSAAASEWDGRDERGRPLPRGVYWVRCPGVPAAARLVWIGR